VIYFKIETIKFNGESDGTKDTIEIDESVFGKKRKYNRGTSFDRQWVFGIVERTSRKTYFVPVESRSKEVLLSIIQSRIEKGAIIHHDDWSAYRNLSQCGYEDDVVVHTREFKSVSGTCTNTVEGNNYVWTMILFIIVISLFAHSTSNGLYLQPNIHTIYIFPRV
jgi:transposase-like protein